MPLLDVLRLDQTVTFRDLLESQEERLITFEEDGEDTIVHVSSQSFNVNLDLLVVLSAC